MSQTYSPRDNSLTASEVADKFDITRDEAERALETMVAEGVLRIDEQTELDGPRYVPVSGRALLRGLVTYRLRAALQRRISWLARQLARLLAPSTRRP